MAPIPSVDGPQTHDLGFTVSHQKVSLDIDLHSRSLRGRTEIIISPHSKDVEVLFLDCRQCEVTSISINNKSSKDLKVVNGDPYKRMNLPYRPGIHQYHMLMDRLEPYMKELRRGELAIKLPSKVRVEELDPNSEETQSLLLSKSLGGPTKASDATAAELAQGPRMGADQTLRFTPLTVSIEYLIPRVRDGMQFVGLEEGDLRYPHAYTLNSASGGNMCCLFPCLDGLTARCTWEINITTARTLGDIFPRKQTLNGKSRDWSNGTSAQHLFSADDELGAVSDEDKAVELSVLCSGDLIDEIIDPHNPSQKTTSFMCSKEISAQHVGFAIGAFEEVNLAEFRGGDDDDKVGQNAIPVRAYCVPGRVEETKNTCLPIAQALDHIALQFGSFPYATYSLCFVDDAPSDIHHTSTLTTCSSRLLFPEDVLDPIDTVTRLLVYALATQWMGIDIVPQHLKDSWAIFGMAYFMTDSFMRRLCGKNDYRFRQKLAADRVVDIDVGRPSLIDLGPLLSLDPLQSELMELKAPLVLFILDQRILKGGSSLGVTRIIQRILLNAKTGDIQNGALDTGYFIKLCEKLSHAKLETFFSQWVYGAGCPKFRVTQRFNKKKLVVEMTITQVQSETVKERALESQTFLRDVKEEVQEVYAGEIPSVFTGPMTIRIHEADGTPYEHIVEIKDRIQKFDIPYNTKYKRLKRSRRQKERTGKAGETEYAGDDSGDVLLYCLGDILQSESEMETWKFVDWSADDEEKMSQESYEWIRMDADFEWICRMSLGMPGYMYVSQLQQDRDVVAQYESIQFLEAQMGHALISTFLTRTLMDSRYFHGIRTAAVTALAKNAREASDWIALTHLDMVFRELFCYPHSSMTRPNDFSNRAAYLVQCAIPEAFGAAKDPAGRSPFRARAWLLDKLKYNDNSNNDYSDSYYVAILMKSLASAMSTKLPFHESEDLEDPGEDDIRFQKACLEEIDRYRRVDEWIPSYHNVISQAALDCKQLLGKAKMIKYNPVDFLQYTSDSTSSLLRIKAFSNLMECALMKNDALLRFFLSVLGTDPSWFVRAHLLQILGRILGSVAIGAEDEPDTATADTGDLVVEQEASTETRKADHARKFTITGALDALKVELGSNQVLQEGLLAAVTSSVITIRESWQLLEICDKLFIPHTSMVMVFKLPRYWSCKRVGKGKFVFRHDGPLRKKPLQKLIKDEPEKGGSSAPKAKGSILKLKFPSMSAASGARSPASSTPVDNTKNELVRRESMGGAARMFKIKPPKPPQSIAHTQVSGNSMSNADGQTLPDSTIMPEKKKLIKLKLGKPSPSG